MLYGGVGREWHALIGMGDDDDVRLAGSSPQSIHASMHACRARACRARACMGVEPALLLACSSNCLLSSHTLVNISPPGLTHSDSRLPSSACHTCMPYVHAIWCIHTCVHTCVHTSTPEWQQDDTEDSADETDGACTGGIASTWPARAEEREQGPARAEEGEQGPGSRAASGYSVQRTGYREQGPGSRAASAHAEGRRWMADEDGKLEVQPRDGEVQPRDGEVQPRDGEMQPRDGEMRPRDGEMRPRDGEMRPRDGEDGGSVEWTSAGDGVVGGCVVWTADEDDLLRAAVSQHGHRWGLVAASLPGRSDQSVRRRWNHLPHVVSLEVAGARLLYGLRSSNKPSACTNTHIINIRAVDRAQPP